MIRHLKALPKHLFSLLWGEPRTPLLQQATQFCHSPLFLYLCASISLLCLALHVHFAFSPAIWLDPAATLCIIDNSYAEMISITAQDVHPPLYYIIVKALIDALHALIPDLPLITAGKVVSILPFGIALLLCVTVVRKSWGTYTAAMAILAVTCVPHLMKYGTEIRMYGWAMLFIFACYLYALNALRTGSYKHWILFASAGLCAAYTHTYACLAVMPIYVYAGYRSLKQGRRSTLLWLGACGIAVIGFFPWLFILLQQAQIISEGYWIPPMTWQKAGVFFIMPFFPKEAFTATPTVFPHIKASGIFFALVAAFLTLSYLTAILNRPHLPKGLMGSATCGISLYIFASIIGVAASYLIVPVIMLRYTIPAFPCMWLGFILLGKIRKRNLYQLLLAAFMLSAAAHSISCYISTKSTERAIAEKLIGYTGADASTAIITDCADISPACYVMLGKDTYTFPHKMNALWALQTCYSKGKIRHLENAEALREVLRTHAAAYLINKDPWLQQRLKNWGINVTRIDSLYCFFVNFELCRLTLED